MPEIKADKAARDYLKASGASAISVVAIDGVCTFHTGHKIDPKAVAVYWLPEANATLLVKQARHDAGRAPDAATVKPGDRWTLARAARGRLSVATLRTSACAARYSAIVSGAAGIRPPQLSKWARSLR
jgi:hypothetical protein